MKGPKNEGRNCIRAQECAARGSKEDLGTGQGILSYGQRKAYSLPIRIHSHETVFCEIWSRYRLHCCVMWDTCWRSVDPRLISGTTVLEEMCDGAAVIWPGPQFPRSVAWRRRAPQ